MAKQIIYGEEARKALKNGIDKLEIKVEESDDLVVLP